MRRSPEFDSSRAAEAAFQAINDRFPGKVTKEDADHATEEIVNKARVLDFVSPLAINRLHKIASGRNR